MKTYAREITKELLKNCGIESVSADGSTIVVNGETRKFSKCKSGKKTYYTISVYDQVERAKYPQGERGWIGHHTFGVHVINYVWNVADKPEGYVVDHIDNDPFNNDISNLQLLTCAENLEKERKTQRVLSSRTRTEMTRDDIINKIEYYNAAYEQAKKDKDANACHLLRSSRAYWQAKLRAFEADPKKYIKPEPEVNPCHDRAEKRRELLAAISEANKFYRAAKEYYGKDDPYTYKCWCEWKMAIAEHYAFCEENKKQA